ncbi:MAG: undecaprenyl-diphosphate phosphatase [Candidatus Binatus sp.]|uniref:undecaprenyl-diphosphate phosphatase n=1 Tax=Candidatus Binatus sp. TaxID=2811406 RepID=UPI003BAFD9B2
MLSHFQAAVLGVLQGVSELFPISSLGHSVILPGLLGWPIDQNADYFVTFVVATHFATALTLFIVYWDDWARIVSGLLGSIWAREFRPTNPGAKLGLLLIIGTVPAGAAGLVFQKQLQELFISPAAAALFLMLNGGLLYLAERLRRTAKPSEEFDRIDRRIAARMSWWQAAKVGIAQVLALLPGFSRTGSTIAGGLLIGFSHEEALRFSFLLATPIIGAAALLKLPVLFHSGSVAAIENALLGAVCAAAAASVSIKILTRYFHTKTLTPFAIYCAAVGLLSLIALG